MTEVSPERATSSLLFWLARLGALLALVGLMLSCGNDVQSGSKGLIETFPRTQITFSQVSLGDQRKEELAITNQGSGDLNLVSITFEGSSDLTLEFPRGLAEGLVLAPKEVYTLLVAYQPSATGSRKGGKVIILSNDPDRAQVEVLIVTQDLGARIQVTPSSSEKVNFGHVGLGESENQVVHVTNVGQIPLEVSDIFINGSDEFTLDLGSLKFPATIQDITEELTFTVAYSPKTLGEDLGSILIQSNDPIDSDYELPLVANSSAPCIQLLSNGVGAEVVEFSPAVAVGDLKTRVVTIKSCGGVPLILESLTQVTGDSSELFINETTPLAGLELAPLETVTFEVLYSPLNEGVDVAEYSLKSNDTLRSDVRFQVLATGTTNQCPMAVAKGAVDGSSVLEEQVAAIPLDVLILDGTKSRDVESSVAEWRWEVTQRPEGSTSFIEDSGDGFASLFLDLAGAYEVCLSVVDAQGTESCNVSCVQANARPSEKIHVQLIWTTPLDPIVGDGDGADIDLHFTRVPQGIWGDTGDPGAKNGWDVFFLNREVVWNMPGLAPETPSLDRDDTDGEGPENVNLDDPNACGLYAVGIHYFDDNGFGTSYATIRIFVNGQRRFQKINVPVELGGTSSGDFWYVALLHWDGSTARIFDIDERFYGGDWVGMTPTIPAPYQAAIDGIACP